MNTALDRLVDFCNDVLTDSAAPRLRRPAVKRLARGAGDLAMLLQHLPRVPAWIISDGEMCLVYLGAPASRDAMQAWLFPHGATVRKLGRVALWTMPHRSRAWLDAGADLVIQERSRLTPWKPQARLTFDVPTWINMGLELPDDLSSLLAGNKRKRVRQRVKKGLEAGFEYRFSQDAADFDLFHHRMYRPFIGARYGEALLSRPEDQRRGAFAKGGLVLVTLDGQPVAGALCYIANGTCYSVEGGVLDADPALLRSEVNGILDWYSMAWAKAQGARRFSFGGTRPLRADGVYLYKQQWGARAMPRSKIYPVWSFAAERLRPALAERLNRLGFVCETRSGLHGLHLHTGPQPVCPQTLQALRQDWRDDGVDDVTLLHTPARCDEAAERRMTDARQPVAAV